MGDKLTLQGALDFLQTFSNKSNDTNDLVKLGQVRELLREQNDKLKELDTPAFKNCERENIRLKEKLTGIADISREFQSELVHEELNSNDQEEYKPVEVDV